MKIGWKDIWSFGGRHCHGGHRYDQSSSVALPAAVVGALVGGAMVGTVVVAAVVRCALIIATVTPLARFSCHKTPITSIQWHPTDESMLVDSKSAGAYIYNLSVEEDVKVKDNTNTTSLVANIPPQLLCSIASDPQTRIQFGTATGNRHALPQQARKKFLRYDGFNKELLVYQKQIHERYILSTTKLKATTDLNSEAATDLNLEATTGLEATSSTTTVAKLCTSASAVPVESLTLLSSTCASIASNPHTIMHALPPERAHNKLLRY
jgi:hypothetical protein